MSGGRAVNSGDGGRYGAWACCNIFSVSLPVISHIIWVYALTSIWFSTCGIGDMFHITFPHYSKFLSNCSTPEKGNVFVRNAAKTYELAPAINKAEIFCQVMKEVPGSVVLDICQSLHPSKVHIKHFQVFPCTSQQWPRQHNCESHPTWFIREEADVGKRVQWRARRSCPCHFLPLQRHCSDPHCFSPGLLHQPPNWSPATSLTHLQPQSPWEHQLSQLFSD